MEDRECLKAPTYVATVDMFYLRKMPPFRVITLNLLYVTFIALSAEK
jgi:hypothetical protein